MILCISSSSPETSVALLAMDGSVQWSEREVAQNRGTSFVFSVLERRELDLSCVELFAADLGPGSFSGVRVGVTIAKTLAYAQKKQVAGASAFDLVSRDATVVLPARRGEFFVRPPGEEPYRSTDVSKIAAVGYPLGEFSQYPAAQNIRYLLENLTPIDPSGLLPEYLAEPSISLPIVPFKGMAS